MRVLNVRNVCEALPLGVELLLSEGQKQSSRAGDVLVAPWPVATVYARPTERVLFSQVRDANPFFHLMEAVWMLAGRNDAAFLNNYVRDFGDRFADRDVIAGAYGHRWRSAFGFDQLKTITIKLQKNPDDRQCVLQMWDCDPRIGSDDLLGTWKDRPCNTQAYFRIRNPLEGMSYPGPKPQVLDMAVTCRSNDIIFGAYGANAVHFSFLQEYLAAMIGVGVGTYTQFSFNYHMYVDAFEVMRKKMDAGRVVPQLGPDHYPMPYLPLVTDPGSFDQELTQLSGFLDHLHVDEISSDTHPWDPIVEFRNRFLVDTVWTAAVAMRWWRLGKRLLALDCARHIEAPDWRIACTEWLERRMPK